MKNLLIMRHAKTSIGENNEPDRERKLNERGISDASLMGRFIVINELIPDQMITSPATRARSTANLLAKEIGQEIPISECEHFYSGTVDDYLSEIKKQDDKIKTLLVIGHNPLIEELFSRIAGAKINIHIGTGTMIRFDIFSRHWAKLEFPELRWIFSPKLIRNYR